LVRIHVELFFALNLARPDSHVTAIIVTARNPKKQPTPRGGRATDALLLPMARDLVTIPNAGGLRPTEMPPNPDRIPAIRKAANATIVQLGGK
jgi:hypothetical protein